MFSSNFRKPLWLILTSVTFHHFEAAGTFKILMTFHFNRQVFTFVGLLASVQWVQSTVLQTGQFLERTLIRESRNEGGRQGVPLLDSGTFMLLWHSSHSVNKQITNSLVA